jgi:uncharacterized protein (TIGR02466 family)
MSEAAAAGRSRLLFATPLILDEVQGADARDAELERLILARRAEHPGLKLSNRGGWQSSHDFTSWAGEPGRALVARAAELATAHSVAADGSAPRWAVEAWANVSGPGAFNMPHVHGGSYWSAVYYVRTGAGDGGQLVLHDPRMPGLRMHAPGLRFRNAGPELRVEIKPKPGLMVLFPAWLSHSVEPWDGNGERISVAMNIRAAALAPGSARS